MPADVATWLARRVLSLIPVLLGVSLLAFGVANLAPGDPAEIILQRQTGEPPTAEAVRDLRAQLGLDRPFPQRYARWLSEAVRGNLGTSYSTGGPVLERLWSQFPATLQLAAASLLLAVVIGVPLGGLAAVYQRGPVDHFSRILALAGASVPSFVLGYLLILVFAVALGWLPVAGTGTLSHLILPVLTLGLAESAALARLTRAAMLDVLTEDYIRTAWAKGLPSRVVNVRHALRNALNPVATLLGLRFGRLLGGAVIVESIFARGGIGRTLVDSIFDRDYPMIQGFILFAGTVFVCTNLLVDISYVWLDPRLSLAVPKHGGIVRAE